MAKGGYPLPTIINPPTTICVQLDIPNEINHVNAFMGQLWNLGRWFSWQGDEAKTGKQVADVWLQIYEELESKLYTDMCGCEDKKPPMLRTNPDDKCQIQYLDQDTGLWVTFFDFGECSLFQGIQDIRPVIDYQVTQEAVAIVNDNRTIYNTDPATYPPQVDVNALAVANRDTLICYSLRVIMTTTLETMARNKGQADANAITLGMIIGAGAVLLFAPFTPMVAGGVLLAFGAGWFGGIATINVSSLRNQNALDEVICHIYGALEGDNMSRASFTASLAVNPFDEGTDAYRQAQILAPMMADVNFYLAFIEHMKLNIPTVGALVNECIDCGDEWTVTLDFRESTQGFSVVDGWGGWVSGFGFGGITKLGTTGSPVNAIITRWWGTPVNITSFRAYTVRSEGRLYNYSDMESLDASGGTFTDVRTIPSVGNGWQAVRVGGSDWQGIRAQMSGTAFGLTTGGIQQVEIKGTGFNPFA